MRWAGHVARMGEERGAYRVLVGKPEGKRPLGIPWRRWVNNIRKDLQEAAQDGGKVSLTHRPPLPPRKCSWYSFLLEAIVRSEGFYVNEKSTNTSWDRTSDLPICSTAP